MSDTCENCGGEIQEGEIVYCYNCESVLHHYCPCPYCENKFEEEDE